MRAAVGDELELTSRLDASMVVGVRISGVYHVDRPHRSVLVGGPAAAGRGQHQRPLPDDRSAAQRRAPTPSSTPAPARVAFTWHAFPDFTALGVDETSALRARLRDLSPRLQAALPEAHAAGRHPAGTDPGAFRALAAGQPHRRAAAHHPAGGAGRLRHRADREPAGRAPPRAHRPAALARRRHRPDRRAGADRGAGAGRARRPAGAVAGGGSAEPAERRRAAVAHPAGHRAHGQHRRLPGRRRRRARLRGAAGAAGADLGALLHGRAGRRLAAGDADARPARSGSTWPCWR